MVYSILNAKKLHGSGIIIQQAFKAMNWKFPKPETVPEGDRDRLTNDIIPLMFAYMGPGFSG